MRVVVDADGCPVVDLAVHIAQKRGIHVVLVCDTAHEMDSAVAEVITVSCGADSADFRIVNLAQPGDLVITQDYGLAAMCLGRGARALHQDGMEYTENNIDQLLLHRHTAREVRMAGGRTKGPKKRQRSQDTQFAAALEGILSQMVGGV